MSKSWYETEEGKAAVEAANRRVLDENLREYLLCECQAECIFCAAFRKLAHRLLDDGCTVCIQQNREDSAGGYAHPSTIHINRHDSAVNVLGISVELIVLAHEAGHWLSSEPGKRHPRMDEVLERVAPGMNAEDHRIQMEEEERAWDLGGGLLAEIAPGLPSAFWELWEAQRDELLATYRVLRGRPPSRYTC